jgi:hypothetical protein
MTESIHYVNANQAALAGGIKRKAAPGPVLWQFHQAFVHGIRVHVMEFFFHLLGNLGTDGTFPRFLLLRVLLACCNYQRPIPLLARMRGPLTYHRPYPGSLTLIAQSLVQFALALLLEQVVEGFPLRVRLLLEDGAVDFEGAFHGS